MDTFTKTYKDKTIQKVYFRKWLIYNKKHYENIPIYGYEFEVLKANPFLIEEVEENLYNKFNLY